MSEIFERADSAPDQSDAHLDRGHLGRTALISLSLASFIPAVSFALAPSMLFGAAGPAAWQSSLLAVVVLVCVGCSVVYFARRYVATGSLYSYVGHVFGPWARYLTGAALVGGYIVGVAGLIGVVGVFIGSFLHSMGVASSMTSGPQVIVLAATAVIAAAIAFRGLDTSIRIAVGLAVLSIPLVVVIAVASAMHTGLDLGTQFDLAHFSIADTLRGTAIGTTFLMGFESCAAMATETRDPRRNIPIAVMAVPVIVGGALPLFTILQVPGIVAASDQLAAGASSPAALADQAGLGSWVGTVSDLVLGFASFASAIGFLNYGARFALTLAEDGLLPTFIARVHRRHKTPYIAIAALAGASFLWIAGMTLWQGDIVSAYTPTATLVVYLWVIPYILIATGAVVLTVRARQFRPIMWLAAVVAVVAMAGLMIDGIDSPEPGAAGYMAQVSLCIIAALVVVFMATKQRRPQSAHEATVEPSESREQ
ncbi:APC family permease [Nocardia sp. NPDC004582]